jgi:hypothetical protein
MDIPKFPKLQFTPEETVMTKLAKLVGIDELSTKVKAALDEIK